jgi:hypothetical protein
MLPGAKHKLRWLQLSIKCHCKCGGKNGRPAVKKITQAGYQSPLNLQNHDKPLTSRSRIVIPIFFLRRINKPPEFRPKGFGIEILRHLRAHNALLAHPSPRAIGATVEKKSFALGGKPAGKLLTAILLVPFSSNPSPERIDEKVGGESPLTDEHTGSGGIRYSA